MVLLLGIIFICVAIIVLLWLSGKSVKFDVRMLENHLSRFGAMSSSEEIGLKAAHGAESIAESSKHENTDGPQQLIGGVEYRDMLPASVSSIGTKAVSAKYRFQKK